MTGKIIKSNSLLLSLLLFLCSAATAQEGVGLIEGSIIDEDGNNLIGATVYMQELKRGEVSDAKGKFVFTNVPVGTHTLTIQYMGYQTQSLSVTVGKTRIRFKA